MWTSRAAVRSLLLTLCVWCSLSGTARAGDAAEGKTLYQLRCAFCHGMAGTGDGPGGAALKPPPTDFTSPGLWKTTNPQALKATIGNGKPGTAMLAFKASLTIEQIDDLVAYLQTFKPKP
jgi:mono/diheme cytochrome c family protein